ncbi:unnamed protein product [Bursaphelenchus xylophilus]|nr:unnamed protein product [Bursaphelenchus xylophilus]CAG9102319.1 unnamed protein product [Bursaphelenchus xylophilus]
MVKRCIRCRIYNTRPYETPMFPPLPTSRTTTGTPFESTGLDICGPLQTKDGPAYVLLLTCLRTRSVHLELTDSIKTEDILNAMTKFCARRGVPRYILSDNATYFVAGRKMFLEKYGHLQNITWTHTTPNAPWRGATYERLNRSLKEGIKRTLGRSRPSYKELETLVIAIEGTLNNRPLLPLYDDNDSFEALRPVDFLRPNGTRYDENGDTANESSDPDFVIKAYKINELRQLYDKFNERLDKFWARWRKEYLDTLADRGNYQEKQTLIPKPGELVILEEPEQPRGEWKMARIKRAIKSKDGITRNCEIILPNRKTAIRAVNLLHPLEIGGEVEGEELDYKTKEDLEREQKQPVLARCGRPRRNKLIDYTPLLMLLTLVIGGVNGQTNQPKLCLGKTRVLWRMPDVASCDYDLSVNSDVGKPRRIELYKRNTIEFHSPAYICRLEATTVRQQTLLNGVPEVREDQNPPEVLSEEECKKMIVERKCKHGELVKGKSIYRTHNTVSIDPPNRIMTFLNGEKVEVKRNCLLLETKVFAHYGSPSATSAMGDLSGCTYSAGICRTKENEIFVWKVNQTQRCEFVKAYQGVGVVTDKSAVIEDLHAMVTFNTTITKSDCNQTIIPTDQGLGIRIGPPIKIRGIQDETPDLPTPAPFIQPKDLPTMPTTTLRPTSRPTTTRTTPIRTEPPRRTTTTATTKTTRTTTTGKGSGNPSQMFGLMELLRGATKEDMMAKGYDEETIDKFLAKMKPRWSRQANLDVSDEESSDLQFAEYYTLKQMRHLARAMCAMLREHSTRIREVISINPTVTMQRLLNRTNIVANRLSDDIVEVEMCHSLNKKEYQFKPSPDECVIPIRINQYNTTLFLNRHTQILHRSKETAKEENCGPTMNVIIDGQVYEYNRMTGKTTPIKEQAKQVKLEEKDQWHFLDQQYIFKDIILHKSNVFQNCHLDYLSAPKLIAKFIFESTIKRFVYVLGEFVIIMIWTCAFKKQLFASIPAFVEVIISWRFLVLPQSFPYLQKNIFFSTIVTTFVIACLKKNLKISLSGK